MSDLFEDPFDDAAPGDNAPEFTVSEISGAVKKTIEGGFARVRVRGEMGRVSRPRSGHIYLDLKDDRSVLAGVIWKGNAGKLTVQPEEGLEVIATGRLTTFPGQSKYQMVIDSIAPAGVGALMAMLDKRKKMLEAEGLFAPERKRPLPYLPEVIGVITSPSGAVIRDILHRLRDRFPRRVLIWPVAVQGERCAPEVTRAIQGFNAMTPGGALPRPDLLIVARGGGSIEDLWGFNEESVARAAAASEIPLISAVGHETDTTLIDYVADRRAPTPTAAAELAVPVRADLLAWTAEQGSRLTGTLVRGMSIRRQQLRDLARVLPRPEELTRPASQRLDMLSDRLPRALRGRIDQGQVRLGKAAGALRPSVLTSRLRTERQRLAQLDKDLTAAMAEITRARSRALSERAARLSPGMTRQVSRHRLALTQTGAGLSLRPVRRALTRAPQDVTALFDRARLSHATGLERRRQRFDGVVRLLASLNYKATLARGYAVVRAGPRVLTSAASAATEQRLELEFHDGPLVVMVGDQGTAPSTGAAPKPAPAARSRTKKQPPPIQTSLFDDEGG
ncbi:exodeoxyribonuclease VII large subunit [Pseudoruegeria sp. SK021]|uniref:exodeoxyribonuclease VII large subunit n=1 Tax=Pseudoruegeria sp. SK021 TaxID=1933035 RepID=UPI000A21BFBF|nr:exodeoxyribonuclease VII large subunit [Pseudoruegeria sp. SK021]OSP56689.1 exodeoxyribonuclease VII large subunit [Pseudoruegeria sp. SK021]